MHQGTPADHILCTYLKLRITVHTMHIVPLCSAKLAAERHQRSRSVVQNNFEMRRSIDMRYMKPDAKGYSSQPTTNIANLFDPPAQQTKSAEYI